MKWQPQGGSSETQTQGQGAATEQQQGASLLWGKGGGCVEQEWSDHCQGQHPFRTSSGDLSVHFIVTATVLPALLKLLAIQPESAPLAMVFPNYRTIPSLQHVDNKVPETITIDPGVNRNVQLCYRLINDTQAPIMCQTSTLVLMAFCMFSFPTISK